ncbi:phosphonate metabolism protein/1,5-bisphosphokinase (PRPP-forming) PhnN [Pseudomonas aeruginosa]|nr:phosphonate metabolism protein/1,5-bisphosphokinase (PRPP-forming) PhnN [Pseudomonas aeruginosa]
MGPSGSGKDSLLQAAREPLALRGCRIVRRVITRSAEAVGEDAQAVTPAQFDTLERASAFAMSWRANGLCYGIPVQIDEWLAQGYDVLVNGSRGYLAQARRRYPDLLAVLLGVKPEVLRQRLLARGRESPRKSRRAWRATPSSPPAWRARCSNWTTPVTSTTRYAASWPVSAATAHAPDPARHRRRPPGAGLRLRLPGLSQRPRRRRPASPSL